MWSDGSDSDDSVRPPRPSASSEVGIFNEQTIVAAVQEVPTVANLNVTRSSGVHIGPKFVNVTNNVQNNDVVKGRFLCLELVSPSKARRLRCSVAVFVCWTLLVALGLAIYLFLTMYNQQTRLDIGLKEPWYLRRSDWQAMPAYKLEYLHLPIKYVVIGNSVTKYCNDKVQCIEEMILLQQEHLRRGFVDIGPNFLASGKGLIFEGRGANVLGVMLDGWNSKIISIMFLGDYRMDKTDQEQLEHVNILLKVLVDKNILVPDYVLYGACQLATFTVSPGPEIMKEINYFSHWNSTNASTCLNETVPKKITNVIVEITHTTKGQNEKNTATESIGLLRTELKVPVK